jgi:hypothetical protein
VNLSNIRDRVRSLTGIRLETLRSDDSLDSVINESYQEIINLETWPFLSQESNVAVASGSNSFTTPSGFSEVNSVSYSTAVDYQTRMRQTTLDELDLLDQDEEGDPQFYARIDGSDFRFWPKSSSAITFSVRGKKEVANLDSDSSSPIFAEQFHPILAYRSSARILAEEGDDSGRSEFYQLEANTFFSRMQQFYIRSADRGLIVMGSRRRRHPTDAY